jgi:hypothetical protein
MKIQSTLRTSLLRLFILIVTIFAALPPSLKAQTSVKKEEFTEAQAAAFAGCYELALGRWWPWSFGKDTAVLVTPPKQIKLLLTRGAAGFEKDRLLIRPLSDSKGSVQGRGGPSYWQLTSATEVDLEWNDGFTGVSIDLEKTGKELSGWAHPHFDAPNFVPRAERVVARKIACPNSD